MTLACHRSRLSVRYGIRKDPITASAQNSKPRLVAGTEAMDQATGQVSEIYSRQLTIRPISPVRSHKLVIIDRRVYIRERYRGGIVMWRKGICLVVGRHIHHVAVEPLGKS